MKLNKSYRNQAIDRGVISWLKFGGVGILPTDTIYGLVGNALNKKTVERIYRLRKRNPNKPMIILIGDMRQATRDRFGIKLDRKTLRILKKIWPGKVSMIFRVNGHESRVKLRYLHRGTNSLAFRLPKPRWLRDLLVKTGPLVAPSVNWEGKPPAKNIKEAKKYFGSRVDFYADIGTIKSKPSRLIKIENSKMIVLRK